MLYVAHAQLPTSVRHALKCEFVKPNEDCVILGKHSLIEVHAIHPDQLQLLHSATIFGVIEHIQSYTKPTNQTATLLVLTSELTLFTLRFCPDTQSIITTANISLHQIGARPADYLQTSVVDPHGRCVLVHALNGILHVIPLLPSSRPKPAHLEASLGRRKRSAHSLHSATSSESDLELSQIFQIRLNEVNVHALAFADLPLDHPPTLLILYSNHLGNRVLRSRSIDLVGANSEEDLCPNHTCADPVTSLIVPIPCPDGPVLLIGEESVELVQLKTTNPKGKNRSGLNEPKSSSHPAPKELVVSARCNLPLGSYSCVCKVEDESDVWLLGDLYGHLLVVRLHRDADGQPSGLSYQPAGRVSSPEALVYISNRFIYLASHYGDCQLLRVSALDSQHTQDNQPEVVANFSNLAPISDFCVVNNVSGFDHQMVTCSGAYQDGSLRIVTHGVTMTDLGMLPIPDAENLWTLVGPRPQDICLVLGFRDHTRFLILQPGQSEPEMEEADTFFGFKSDQRTLVAGNVTDCGTGVGGWAVQVTQEGVVVGDTLRWQPAHNQPISVAAIGASLTAVALQREVLLLHVKDHQLVQSESIRFPHEVSCLAINSTETVLAVGQWITNSIALVSSDDMSVLNTIETGSSFGIHSALFTNFGSDSSTYLLAGMEDGQLMSIKLAGLGSRAVCEETRRIVSLGRRPITMAPTILALGDETSGPRYAVWIHSDRPTIMTAQDDQLQFSPVALGSSTVQAALSVIDSTALAVATADGVRLGRIDSLGKIHITKIPLGGEQPRRIAHSDAMRAYGVVCLHQDLDQKTGELHRHGSVKILDDVTFELLYDFPLLTVEQGTSIAAIQLGPEGVEEFIIGTGLVKAHESQPSAGRILAIGPDTNTRSFRLKRMTRVAGAVQGLGQLPGGKFAASANAFVHAFAVGGTDEPDGFKLLDTWGGGFVSQTVVTDGSWVIVGDLYKSVVVLEFDSTREELRVVGRDYSAMSVRPIGKVSERTFIGADTDFNLFTVEMREQVLEKAQQTSVVDEEAVDDEEEEEEEESEWADEERQMMVEKVFNDDHLTSAGAFHLGQNVNHFKTGSFVSQHSEPGWARGGTRDDEGKLIFVTSTGGIGVVVKIEDERLGEGLRSMEVQMAKTKSTGNLDQLSFRTFKSRWKKVEPKGFIDGDFLQNQRLKMRSNGEKEMMKLDELKAELEDVLEELRWFH